LLTITAKLDSLAVMNTNKSLSELEREIVETKKKLAELGPMHPGSISSQYQMCGNPNCKCMDPKHPQKHGPFYKLSYVFKGKTGCRFIRSACEKEVITRVATYKTFRALMEKWISLSIQSGVIEFFTAPPKTKVAKRKTIQHNS
jgi:hypothetical protein